MSQLRFEFGDQADTIMREVNAFVAKRPALAAFLDESLTGNSVSTIKLLAAAAREPALLTKAGAEKFIAGLKDNKKYTNGDKLEIAKARSRAEAEKDGAADAAPRPRRGLHRHTVEC